MRKRMKACSIKKDMDLIVFCCSLLYATSLSSVFACVPPPPFDFVQKISKTSPTVFWKTNRRGAFLYTSKRQ